MRILANNDKVVLKNGRAVAKNPWGRYQANKWNAIDLYDWIYQCFSDGFSIEGRYYGDASEYMTGIQKLLIPLNDFAFANSQTSIQLIKNTLINVATDNPLFCYSASTTMIENVVYDGCTIVADETGSIITGVWIYAPNDSLRNEVRSKTLMALNDVKNTVEQYCGYVIEGTMLSEIQKRNVAKVLHDFIMSKSQYATTINYWSKTAFSALIEDDNLPICVGYASAFSYLCHRYNINAIYVEGSVDISHPEYINHAWNMVSFELPYGLYSGDPSKWSAVDLTYDDGRHDNPDRSDWWGYFCTTEVYHHKNNVVVTRLNSPKGYPVDVPTKTYTYTGNTLYGIEDNNWTS